jgi:L-amino acid N-acyltransferase YncA
MEQRATIRTAQPDDISAITEIYAESVRYGVASYELEPPSAETMRERYESGVAAGYPWLVTVKGSDIAGYAYASAFRTRPAYRWLVEDSVYFLPQMRGLGLGLMALNRLAEDCAALGFRQMTAVIGGGDPASIAVHRKAGFVVAGCIRASGYKFGQWLDTTIMQRALGEGSTAPPGKVMSRLSASAVRR